MSSKIWQYILMKTTGNLSLRLGPTHDGIHGTLFVSPKRAEENSGKLNLNFSPENIIIKILLLVRA
jgi:hypothetical protein